MEHKCSQCDYSSDKAYNLKRHIARRHPNGDAQPAQQPQDVAGNDDTVAACHSPPPDERMIVMKVKDIDKLFQLAVNTVLDAIYVKGILPIPKPPEPQP